MIVNEVTRGDNTRLVCPNCGNESIWKDGIRKNVSGDVQRYSCPECEYRFSQSVVLSRECNYLENCRLQ